MRHVVSVLGRYRYTITFTVFRGGDWWTRRNDRMRLLPDHCDPGLGGRGYDVGPLAFRHPNLRAPRAPRPSQPPAPPSTRHSPTVSRPCHAHPPCDQCWGASDPTATSALGLAGGGICWCTQSKRAILSRRLCSGWSLGLCADPSFVTSRPSARPLHGLSQLCRKWPKPVEEPSTRYSGILDFQNCCHAARQRLCRAICERRFSDLATTAGIQQTRGTGGGDPHQRTAKRVEKWEPTEVLEPRLEMAVVLESQAPAGGRLASMSGPAPCCWQWRRHPDQQVVTPLRQPSSFENPEGCPPRPRRKVPSWLPGPYIPVR